MEAISANIEVINRQVQPVFANASNFDLAIYTDTSNQAIHFGFGSNAASNAPITLTNSNLSINGNISISNRQVNLTGIKVLKTQPTGIPTNITTLVTSIPYFYPSNTNYDFTLSNPQTTFRFLSTDGVTPIATINSSNTSLCNLTVGNIDVIGTILGKDVSVNGVIDGTTLRQGGVGVLTTNGGTLNGALTVNGTVNATTLQQGGAALVVVPVGGIMPFAGSSAPSGWLLCFGQQVSRTTYVALFAVIGSTYGNGDGSTTFNLPDLRGRVAAGVDNMGGTAANRLTTATVSSSSIGGTGGSEKVRLTDAQCALPSHSHTGSTSTDNGHSHSINDPGHTHSITGIASSPYQANVTGLYNPTNANMAGSAVVYSNTTGITVNLGGAHSHTISINSTSQAASSDTPLLQPTLLMNYIIRF